MNSGVAMSDHARAHDLAAIAIDFELTSEEHDELVAHLAACDACRDYADALVRDATGIEDLDRFDAPAEIRSRVLAPRRAAWPFRLSLLAAMIGTVVVGVGVFAGMGGLPFLGGSSGAGGGPAESDGPDTQGPPSAAASGAPPASFEPAASGAIPGGGAGSAWSALPMQPAFDPAAGAPAQNLSASPPPCGEGCGNAGPNLIATMRAVAEGNDRIVAVGSACRGGPHYTCNAAAWTSEEGLLWDQAPVTDSLYAGSDAVLTTEAPLPGMTDVVFGTHGFLAGGLVSDGGTSRPMIWSSSSGRDWRAGQLADRSQGEVRGLTSGHSLNVAVGKIVEGDEVEGAVWVSADGRDWERIGTGFETAIGPADSGLAGISDVTALENGFVAVGADCSGAENACIPVVWLSGPDGRRWERVAGTPAEGRQMRGIVAHGATLVAVGDAGEGLGRIWTSADGQDWERSETGDVAELWSVVADGERVIAGGYGLLESSNGVAWTPVAASVFASGTIGGLAFGGPGSIAVGQSYDTVGPAVWVSPG